MKLILSCSFKTNSKSRTNYTKMALLVKKCCCFNLKIGNLIFIWMGMIIPSLFIFAAAYASEYEYYTAFIPIIIHILALYAIYKVHLTDFNSFQIVYSSYRMLSVQQKTVMAANSLGSDFHYSSWNCYVVCDTWFNIP